MLDLKQMVMDRYSTSEELCSDLNLGLEDVIELVLASDWHDDLVEMSEEWVDEEE